MIKKWFWDGVGVVNRWSQLLLLSWVCFAFHVLYSSCRSLIKVSVTYNQWLKCVSRKKKKKHVVFMGQEVILAGKKLSHKIYVNDIRLWIRHMHAHTLFIIWNISVILKFCTKKPLNKVHLTDYMCLNLYLSFLKVYVIIQLFYL